ncbi:hypothetical protein SMICM304S_00641 [Streptomyces microflavus]
MARSPLNSRTYSGNGSHSPPFRGCDGEAFAPLGGSTSSLRRSPSVLTCRSSEAGSGAGVLPAGSGFAGYPRAGWARVGRGVGGRCAWMP